MPDFQVLCIQRSLRPLPHECIAQIGGLHADGSRWMFTQEQAIAGIDSGAWRFYVSVGGHATMLVVGTSVLGNNYLKADGDVDQPATLLTLLDCPL